MTILFPRRNFLHSFFTKDNIEKAVFVHPSGILYGITYDNKNIRLYSLGSPVNDPIDTITYENETDYRQDWRGTTGSDYDNLIGWIQDYPNDVMDVIKKNMHMALKEKIKIAGNAIRTNGPTDDSSALKIYLKSLKDCWREAGPHSEDDENFCNKIFDKYL